MHELSYILDIISSVKDVKEKEDLKDIKEIYVNVGKMSGVVPFYLDKYYQEAKKNTFLENTKLIIDEKEVVIECEGCGEKYTPSKEQKYKCPKCGERKGKLLQGKGITIEKIVVDDGN